MFVMLLHIVSAMYLYELKFIPINCLDNYLCGWLFGLTLFTINGVIQGEAVFHRVWNNGTENNGIGSFLIYLNKLIL